MALGHLQVRTGKPGKAAPHAAYISREGPYAKYLSRGERLEAKGVGNMPAWANADPLAFWSAADTHERKNGTTYREMEIALPRELTPTQRKALLQDWIAQELADIHPYQWAIHTPKAADGHDQPHAHLMFSERRLDNILRDPDQFFRRYNALNPANGGCKKGYGPHAGKTLTRQERTDELKALRHRWELTCNHALELAGSNERIDMRSYADQGLDIVPERKYSPVAWRFGGKAEVLKFRKAKAQVVNLRDIAALSIPTAPEVHQPTKPSPDRTPSITRPYTLHLRADLISEIEHIRERRQKLLTTHMTSLPKKPSGLFSALKRGRYETDMHAWRTERKRLNNLDLKLEKSLTEKLEQLNTLLTNNNKSDITISQSEEVHAAMLTALDGCTTNNSKIYADPSKHTAFDLIELSDTEKLKASGFPPAVVAVANNNITVIFKHRPITSGERGRLMVAVDRSLCYPAEPVHPTIPVNSIILEASGATIDLDQLLNLTHTPHLLR